MVKIVLIRPSYETTTRYLYIWNQKVVDRTREKEMNIVDLKKKQAARNNLINVLSQNDPDYVFLNGHGAPDFITGQNGEILIQAGVNEGVLAGKHVHALSCDTGKILGPAAIKKGAKSYIGYDEPFVFVTKQAGLFLDPAIAVSLSLLDGATARQACRASQQAFLENIRILSASRQKKNSYLIRYLLWDKNHQVCLEKNI
jgi:hypothetical protein